MRSQHAPRNVSHAAQVQPFWVAADRASTFLRAAATAIKPPPNNASAIIPGVRFPFPDRNRNSHTQSAK